MGVTKYLPIQRRPQAAEEAVLPARWGELGTAGGVNLRLFAAGREVRLPVDLPLWVRLGRQLVGAISVTAGLLVGLALSSAGPQLLVAAAFVCLAAVASLNALRSRVLWSQLQEQRLRADAERERRAQQREDFVATLTHDLRNPLVGSDRLLSAVLSGAYGKLEPELSRVLEILRRSNRAVVEATHDVLTVYRYEAGQARLRFAGVDLHRLFSTAVDGLAPLAEARGVTVRTSLPPDTPQVWADCSALNQALESLLNNAIRFTPRGGLVELLANEDGRGIAITVRDTGQGIAREDLERIFKRFWNGSSDGKHAASTGLGLYLCRQIVEAHGGTISCDSRCGQGTTVRMRLPRAIPATRESLRESPTP